MEFDVILDCYTDEPSGLGVPPYLGVHSRYVAGCLEKQRRDYYYLTIDDLRYANGERNFKNTYNKRILNTTKNTLNAVKLLQNATNIYVVMGCFVKYDYVSAEPPTFEEVRDLLKKYMSNQSITLFYALGGSELTRDKIVQIIPKDLFSEIIFGNTYNYFLHKYDKNIFAPNYEELREIAIASSTILKQLSRPLMIEIETATGCNRNPGCTFCIEGKRGLPLQFRNEDDIVEEIKALYNENARFFRLGRQPNFYAYQHSKVERIEYLLKSICEVCPEIKTLHIDNAGPQDVNTLVGERITEIITKYCTDGNIAPFGVESFDENVRKECNLNGTIIDIHNAIKIINKYGQKRGKTGMPKLLPGINIIYGLDGQTSKTLQDNLENFKKILESNNMVRRVFVRKLTSPFGEQFDTYTVDNLEEFKNWSTTIEKDFIVPMLKKVFPIGLIISDLRMEMLEERKFYFTTDGNMSCESCSKK